MVKKYDKYCKLFPTSVFTQTNIHKYLNNILINFVHIKYYEVIDLNNKKYIIYHIFKILRYFSGFLENLNPRPNYHFPLLM